MDGYRHQQGFSIMELLVVLIIVGILLSYAMLSLNLGDLSSKTIEEARRMQGLIELAQEEAILKNRELALRIEQDQYEFLQLVEDNWQPIEGESLFRRRQLPQEMQLYLQLAGAKTAGSDKGTSNLIYILSSGEVTPFELVIEAVDGSRYSLQADFLGRMQHFNPDIGLAS